jgi:tRNA threonylcarbamoyladenosine biosynthesis protein TsaE
VPVREVETRSADETEAVGEALGRAVRGGELIGLVGDLGAGKTCVVRGLARGLGVDAERVHSPTFTMVTEYPGGRLPLAHVDLYRLEAPVADEGLLREVLHGDGVAAVEWYDRLASGPADDVLLVTLGFTREGRAIRLDARGAGAVALLGRAALRP